MNGDRWVKDYLGWEALNLLDLKLTQGWEEATFVLSEIFTLPKAGKSEIPGLGT